jgi:hypothetical protein
MECWYPGLPVQGYASSPHSETNPPVPTPAAPSREDELLAGPVGTVQPPATPSPETTTGTEPDALFLYWENIAYPILNQGARAFDAFNNYGRPLYKHVRFALPLSGVEGVVGGLNQLYDDRNNQDLNVPQRLGRAFIVGGEAYFTDLASDAAGLLGMQSGAAAGATIGGPEGAAAGAGLGYLLYSYAISLVVDRTWTEIVNPSLMPLLGLGEWP